jgi:fucose 4-O-acetylase-like acetyltransferase
MFRRLLYLNGISIISVVLFHAAGMGFVAMFAWADKFLSPGIDPMSQIGTGEYYLLRFMEQIAVFCIPAFLFVSGYFIAVATGKSRETVEWRVVLSRVRALVIPYLLWSFVVILLKIFIDGVRLSPSRLAVELLTGATNEVYYFVPLLIQFYLLAPGLVWAARRNWRLLLGITALIQLIPIVLPYLIYLNLNFPWAEQILALFPKWLFLSRIFWFSFGIVFGFQLEAFKEFFYRHRWALLGVAILCIPIGMLEWEMLFRVSGESWLSHRETLIDTLYSIGLITGILSLNWAQFPLQRGVEKLGQESFGIYLMHSLFIVYTAKMIYRFLPAILGNQLILQPILILVGLGFPVLLMYLFDHSPFRKYYAYIFG